VARQQTLEQRYGQGLQRLGQQRVIGEREGVVGDVPGRVPVHAVLVHQQPQQIGVVHAVSEDRCVVGHAVDHQVGEPAHAQPATILELLGAAPEADAVAQLRPGYLPGIAVAQPHVADLDLQAVVDLLIEDPELISDAVADGRDLIGRQRVHVAGCQAAEPPVAEPRLLLLRHHHIVELKNRS